MAKQKKAEIEIIHETENEKLEIVGTKMHYTLRRINKKTGLGVRIFVDGFTSFDKFKKNCKRFIPKEESKG